MADSWIKNVHKKVYNAAREALYVFLKVERGFMGKGQQVASLVSDALPFSGEEKLEELYSTSICLFHEMAIEISGYILTAKSTDGCDDYTSIEHIELVAKKYEKHLRRIVEGVGYEEPCACYHLLPLLTYLDFGKVYFYYDDMPEEIQDKAEKLGYSW